MPNRARIPPGRAGRVWLRQRVVTAERGRAQLDRKLRILVQERERLDLQAARAREEWTAAARTARTWAVRVVVLGGQDALRRSTPAAPLRVEVVTGTAVGVAYPAGARVAAEPVAAELPGNAAVGPARAAARDALVAAAHSAAADEAVRRLTTEIALTRRRVRALDTRWLPWLREALAVLELALEQSEQEDNVRRRDATNRDGRAAAAALEDRTTS